MQATWKAVTGGTNWLIPIMYRIVKGSSTLIKGCLYFEPAGYFIVWVCSKPSVLWRQSLFHSQATSPRPSSHSMAYWPRGAGQGLSLANIWHFRWGRFSSSHLCCASIPIVMWQCQSCLVENCIPFSLYHPTITGADWSVKPSVSSGLFSFHLFPGTVQIFSAAHKRCQLTCCMWWCIVC